MDTPKKIAIGWFSFSCCEDSTIVFTELMNDHWQEWKRIFDFRHAKVLKDNNVMGPFDIAFVEGAIAAPEQVKKLKLIRSLATKLVAIGTCACEGGFSAQRNTFNEEQKAATDFLVEKFGALPKVLKVSEVVTVDAAVPGCPMNTDIFLKAVSGLVAEMRPDLLPQPAPVASEGSSESTR
ncbi:MAG: hypothetical protein A3D65_04340 [Candidatus Lloydbacteria bacterium RIFCSPHIGHO2_02_FULL_50_13]|uniref:NADH:ubiquinone oxidoreductase-like 20kDa subunit domain-containing protein n=1 Tax=Candidatus Lloydbacteria bacterium RIFCSPHIGHO2_02_FULL_50_13 TaxID=1798661 RepID=A0A1G2D2M8_9BACT|nr:MAG: hypothetical protein A3D65_04340 [Candidatus Lloydbacteria bacterium RIFCSPHIGHO2_02_FULL_50_13]